MRHLAVPLFIFGLFVQSVGAQEATPRPPTPEQLSRLQSFRQSSTAPDSSIKPEQSYFVQFTEFRIKHSVDVNRTSSEIAQSFDQLNKEGKIEVIETVRLTVPEHQENSVQFGKTTTVIRGTTRTAQGVQQSLSDVPIGTIVQVKATPQEGKVLLKIAYTVSRMEDDNLSEEKRPDIVTVTIKSTLLLEIGKATLVAGTTSETNDFLMVTVIK